MVKSFAIMMLALLQSGCAAGEYQVKDKANIGYAEISSQGVITLNLIGTGGGGESAHAIKSYKPGDPYYDEVKKHIGAIKAGERKTVAPFPEK